MYSRLHRISVEHNDGYSSCLSIPNIQSPTGLLNNFYAIVTSYNQASI